MFCQVMLKDCIFLFWANQINFRNCYKWHKYQDRIALGNYTNKDQQCFLNKIALDLHDFLSVWHLLSSQGVFNFTNSNIHALVYTNPFGVVFFGSGRLYPLKHVPYAVIKLFSTSHTIEVFKCAYTSF